MNIRYLTPLTKNYIIPSHRATFLRLPRLIGQKQILHFLNKEYFSYTKHSIITMPNGKDLEY